MGFMPAIINTTRKLEGMLNIRPSQIIGLDIDSGAVRMVGLRKNGGGYRVTAAAVSTIESALGSKYATQSDVTAAIEKCLKSSMGNITRNSCFVAGLSGAKVKVSSFNFPSLRLDEVARAVMLETSQIYPFDIQTSVVDYQLIGIDKADLRR